MEKKRTLLVNGMVIAAILLVSLAVLAASKMIDRKIVPEGGQLEMEFEPAVSTQAPSANVDWNMMSVYEEDAC